MGKEDFVTIKLMAIERLAGRGCEHIRCYGLRPDDASDKLVEVNLCPEDVMDVIGMLDKGEKFPEIEVPRWSYIFPIDADSTIIKVCEDKET